MREPAGQAAFDDNVGFLLKQFTLRRIEGSVNLVGQETHLLNGHSARGTEITKTLTGVDPLPAGKQGNHGIGKRAFAGGNLARYGYGSNRQLSAPLSTGEGLSIYVYYILSIQISPTRRPLIYLIEQTPCVWWRSRIGWKQSNRVLGQMRRIV